MSSTVSRVATDALLCSRTGVPLVQRHRVLSRAGTHVAFRGTYMARFRMFIYTADAERRKLRNRNRARSFASRLSPDDPIAGPHGSSCHALSPSRSLPQLRSRWLLRGLVHAGPADGPLLVRSISCYPGLLLGIISRRYVSLCGSRRGIVRLPQPALSTPSLRLNLDTVSSDGSMAGTGDVPSVEGIDIDPIVISDQELSVISVHSDDPDLYCSLRITCDWTIPLDLRIGTRCLRCLRIQLGLLRAALLTVPESTVELLPQVGRNLALNRWGAVV